MKLILFDVDGTLLESDSVGWFDYWKVIIKKHFGIETGKHDIYKQGKTDRAILAEYLKLEGIEKPEKDARFLSALNDIGNVVADEIKDRKLETVSNVREFVERLIREKNIVGLLTGNTRQKAEAKLKNAGIWKYFETGAFGDRTQKRSELVQMAIEDAKEKTGIRFEKKDVYLVGDTIRDIMCAKEAGVKIVAVATGKETIKTLKQEKPDFLFKDFSNTDKMAEVIK